LRRDLGERGQVFVESNYTKERLVADVDRLYRDLLAPQAAGERARAVPEAAGSK
jgi:hypothetical protein